MKRLIRILLLAAVAIMVLPATVALADSDTIGFTSGFSVGQTSPGAIAPIIVITPGGPVQVGVSLTGETFAGTIQGCSGQHCSLLEGASLTVNQNATLYFTDPYGTSFAGPVNGTFTISKKVGKSVQSISGTYSGSVTAGLAPIPGYPVFAIQGSNNSAWTVNASTATGGFKSLKEASGSIAAAIGGYFPGGEVIYGTISGTTKDDKHDDHSDKGDGH